VTWSRAGEHNAVHPPADEVLHDLNLLFAVVLLERAFPDDLDGYAFARNSSRAFTAPAFTAFQYSWVVPLGMTAIVRGFSAANPEKADRENAATPSSMRASETWGSFMGKSKCANRRPGGEPLLGGQMDLTAAFLFYDE